MNFFHIIVFLLSLGEFDLKKKVYLWIWTPTLSLEVQQSSTLPQRHLNLSVQLSVLYFVLSLESNENCEAKFRLPSNHKQLCLWWSFVCSFETIGSDCFKWNKWQPPYGIFGYYKNEKKRTTSSQGNLFVL